MDSEPETGWRESEKLAPNFRIQSQTNETLWTVDIYSGKYYVVGVKRTTEICRSIQSIIGYLCRMLDIQPQGVTGSM
jgi:hypothetical protein